MTMTTTLAFDIVDNIGLIIFIAIMVGGWVLKTIKSLRDSLNTPGNRSAPGSNKQRPAPAVSGDDVAARRRREIETLTARRRAMPDRAGLPSDESDEYQDAVPTNMDSQQLRQRQTDQQAYQQRAQAMRERARTAGTQQPSPSRSQSSVSPQSPARRTPSRPTSHPSRSQTSSQTPSSHPTPITSAPAVDSNKNRLTSINMDAIHKKHTLSVSDSTFTSATKSHVHSPRRLRGQTLREAIVLREILDKPVALRTGSL